VPIWLAAAKGWWALPGCVCCGLYAAGVCCCWAVVARGVKAAAEEGAEGGRVRCDMIVLAAGCDGCCGDCVPVLAAFRPPAVAEGRGVKAAAAAAAADVMLLAVAMELAFRPPLPVVDTGAAAALP